MQDGMTFRVAVSVWTGVVSVNRHNITIGTYHWCHSHLSLSSAQDGLVQIMNLMGA